MSYTTPQTPGIVPGRLKASEYQRNFSDIKPALSEHEALVEADRCYFCHDAPCITACPTAIDIPLFIRQIATGTPTAAAETIFSQNILGGICARVCPTETLCEQACVRETAEKRPVEIGRLQRFATDALMAGGVHPFEPAPNTGRNVAVVGAGPAGMACAHRLAMLGHVVRLMDGREKGGGLNEYGIAAYKTAGAYAERELDWLMGIGNIRLRLGRMLGRDLTLQELQHDFDAVFLAMGLGGVNLPDIPGTGLAGVEPAVEFISRLRQSENLSGLPVGRSVVVIGGGMTAVDAAVQSRLLGAEDVSLVYRRRRQQMAASRKEQEHAARHGVNIICNARPAELRGEDGKVTEAEFAYTRAGRNQGLRDTGERFTLDADQVLIATGQKLAGIPPDLRLSDGRVATDGNGRTSMDRVWAGGDCAAFGEELTVTAVAQGRDAAMDIHARLMEEE